MLRLLQSVGLYKENENQQFELDQMGHLLRTDINDSMRDYVLFIGSDWIWKVWENAKHSIETGDTSQNKTYGKSLFDHLNENENKNEIFNRAMTCMTLTSAGRIVNSYDFSKFKTIIDIGGGNGILLAKILIANPQLKGILYDLPTVMGKAEAIFVKEGVRDRASLVTGSFFKSIPKNYDAYLLKYIVHDWDDENNLIILNKLQNAMHQTSKLLIVETIFPESKEPGIASLRDLHMMFLTGGKERTKEEYKM
ncbi:MAG: hypothetical protein NVSMB45_08670 [Ginsengibacter sp.]